MEIRLLTPPDAEDYWKLRLEALKNNPEAFATAYEEAVKRVNPVKQTEENFKNKGNHTFGAFEEDELVGVVTLLQDIPLKLKHKATICAMYVSPAMRGKGIGKKLLMEAIRYAKSIDIIEILNLSVVATNKNARKLYTELGFKAFGIESKALKYNHQYYDEEHMSLVWK